MHSIPRILAVSATLLFALAVLASRGGAQHSNFQSSVAQGIRDPAPLGRDYWFVLPAIFTTNEWVGELYITSQKATTVFVSIANGIPEAIAIKANTSKLINLGMGAGAQTTSSGHVEDR